MRPLEKDIQKDIADYLKARGFLVWKNHMGAMQMGAKRCKNPNTGMPDLCAVKNGKTYYIEVKTPKGKVSNSQREWHEKAYKHGVIVHVLSSIDETAEIFG